MATPPYIDESGNLVIWITSDGHGCYIPHREVCRIKARMENEGLPYNLASTLYNITREHAGVILAADWGDLSWV